MLKKAFLLLLLISIFSSCNIEELDSVEANGIPVQGIWKLSELNIQVPLDINGDSITHTNILDETGIIDATITFDNDSEGSIFYRSWIGFNTMEEDGKLIFLVVSELSSDHAPEKFTYSFNNNRMLIDTDITFNKAYSESSELSMVDGELHLIVPNGFVVKDEISLEESINEDLTYVFTKQ